MGSEGDEIPSLLSRRRYLSSTVALGSTAFAGCTSAAWADEDEDGLTGGIRISGSSTVYPIAQEVSRRFKQNHPQVSFNLTRDGSSGGFENVFIPGDSDINNASRLITKEEVLRLRAKGIEPVEFFIARDALTVIVNNDNDWIDALDLETLAKIWSPETAPETWADVNPEWPSEPLDLYGPATTSGTFDYFTEAVVGESGKIREDFEGTEEDDLIAQGVSDNAYAMGYVPFAYYTNNPDSTRALGLKVGEGEPVEPSLQAAQSGTYPLARPLFYYANMKKIRQKPQLQAFIRFYARQAAANFVSEEIGYVPSNEQMVEENLQALQAAIAGDYKYEL